MEPNESSILSARTKQMNELQNTYSKVKFRETILSVQKQMDALKEPGKIERECYLNHHFSPKTNYGCFVYAREIFIPKGQLIIGKIHRHGHLNFILKGKVRVNTEFGLVFYEAPCTFVSEPGVKRAVYAEEDTTWTTIHTVKYGDEEHLKEIEDEVISPTYEEIGLIASTEELARIDNGSTKNG